MLKVNLDRLANALKKVDWDPNRLDCVGRDLYRKYQMEMQDVERNINIEKDYEKIYYAIIEEVNNTINWNVEYQCTCTDCECCSMRVVLTPKLFHKGKYVCNLCHRHNKWITESEYNEALWDL